MTRPIALQVAMIAIALGCGSSDTSTGTPDASVDADASSGLAIDPPAPPAAPVLTPCRPGWVQIDGDPPTCAPRSGELPPDCPAGTASFPGEPACSRVGTECPSDGFPADVPADGSVLYVSAAAAAGGDGTRARPFARIGDALARAATGTTIAIGAGRYDESLTPPGGVTLVGACPVDTVLTSSLVAPVIEVQSRGGATVTVRNLRIADPAFVGIAGATAGADLRLESVVVERATDFGIVLLADAHLSGERVVVASMRSARPTQGGAGIAALGARLELRKAAVVGAIGMGVAVLSRETTGQATLEDVLVADTVAGAGNSGMGIGVLESSVARLSGVELRRNMQTGISVETWASLEAEDVIATDGVEGPMGSGAGLIAFDGSTAIVRRFLVERAVSGAIQAADLATVEVEDVVVRDTIVDSTGTWGRGLEGYMEGRLIVRRALVERSVLNGVAIDSRATGHFEDIVVRDTAHAPDGLGGRGIGVQVGASATFVRTLVERSHDKGVFAAQAGVVRFEDLVVRDTAFRPTDGMRGIGVEAWGGTRLELLRAVVERNIETGIFVAEEGTTAQLDHVVVRDTRSREVDGDMGRGIDVVNAAVTGTFVRVERNTELGIGAFLAASVELAHVEVLDTAPAACGMTACPLGGTGGGSGVVAAIGGRVRLERLLVSGSAQCGVQVARDGSLDLRGGVVRGNTIGACVQVPGYDLARLQDGVAYEDNESPIQSTTLPEPNVSVPDAL